MRKLIHAKREAEPEKAENAFRTSRFMALLSLALAAATTGQNGTNINDFRHNKDMAAQKMKAPSQAEVEAQQQAVKMVAAFKEFILTGNAQKKTEFNAIFDANSSAAFKSATSAEFKKTVVADPKLGPMVEAWKKKFGGFDATDFLAFVDGARAAANDAALYEQLKKSGPEITKGVLDPLVAIYVGPAVESASVAAGTFVGMLAAYKRSDRERSANNLRRELTTCTTSGGEFVSGFYTALSKALNDQSPQAAAILKAYAKDRSITKMNSQEFSKMLDAIVVITQEVYAPPYNMAMLQARHGPTFTQAVATYISAQKAAATQGEQMAELKEQLGARLANAKRYATENGLLDVKVGTKTLGEIIGEWEKRRTGAKTLQELQALNPEIPGIQTLHDLEMRIGTSQRLLEEAINGDKDFYVTLGASAWVRNVQSEVANLRNLQNDPMRAKFAAAMLTKRSLDVKDLEGFLDAVVSANTNMSGMLTSLDAFLASETNPEARMYKVGETFGTVHQLIDAMAEKLKPLRPRSTEDELRAEIDRRFMIQFVPATLKDVKTDRVATLEKTYTAMAQDEKFIDFRRNFSNDLNQYISLLQGNASPTNAERMNMASQTLALFRSVESVNRQVNDAKTQVRSIQTDGTPLMETIKGSVALNIGVASNADDAMVQALKSSEVTQAIFSAYAITINMTGQPTMDMVIAQLNNKVKPIDNTPSTLTPAQQANVQAFIASLQGMRQQVNNIMNGVNTAQAPSISLQYAYGAYAALGAYYGPDWRNGLKNKNEEMAKACSFIVGYSTLPPAYGALAAQKTSEALLRSFDDASIGLITRAIASYSQPMIQGEYYDMVITYYDVVSARISNMFTDISSVRADRLEGQEDVRIRTPSEAPDYRDMYIPSINLTIRVYKKIYEEWANEANGVLRVNRSPNITEGPTGTPYILNTAATFMDRRLVESGVNLPLPFIRLPLVLKNISVLAPSELPPVGEALRASGGLDMSYHSTTVERSLDRGAAYGASIAQQAGFSLPNAATVGNILSQIAHNNSKDQLTVMSTNDVLFRQQFDNALATLPPAQAAAITAEETNLATSTMMSSLGNFTSSEKRVSSAFEETATAGAEREGGLTTRATERYALSKEEYTVDGVTTSLNKIETGQVEVTNWVIPAPAGKEGARKAGDYYLVRDVKFDMRNVNDKNQAVSALFSGTWPAGATDAVYLERHEDYDGSTYFEAHAYHRDPTGSFGGAQTMTLTADEAKSMYWGPYQTAMQKLYAGGAVKRGDFIAELDGAVLFSGAFTGKESVSLKQLQGIGGALEPVERYGGSVDYEQTRNGRTMEAFISRDPKNLKFWVGRFTAENLQVDEDGKRRFYGEMQYVEASKAEIKGYLSIAKNSGGTSFWNTAQGAFNAQKKLRNEMLGLQYGGIGAGRMLSETDELGGGKIYGVSADMMKGLVASALYKKYREDNLAGTQYGSDLETMLVSFGVRNMFLQGLEAGAGWEIVQNEGAGFLKYQWAPVNGRPSSVELGAYIFTQDKRVYPMLGKFIEWTPGEGGIRVSNEAYYVLPVQGIGDEVRLRSNPFNLSVGGGVISDIGGGGHLGLMFPVKRGWMLGMFGAVGQDVYTDKNLTQGEFMLGGIHTLSKGTGEGLRLSTITTSLSGIEQSLARQIGPTGDAGQMDLTFGLNWYDAGRGSSFGANIGAMIWGTKLTEATDATTKKTTEGNEVAATLGVSYKAMSLGSRMLDPTFALTGRLGVMGTGETIETPLDVSKSSADRVDWTISAKFSTAIGHKAKK